MIGTMTEFESYEELVDDLPVDIMVDTELGAKIHINHFKSLDKGNGYAKEAMNRIKAKAKDEGREKILLTIGRDGDVKDWLEYMRFEVTREHPDSLSAFCYLD